MENLLCAIRGADKMAITGVGYSTGSRLRWPSLAIEVSLQPGEKLHRRANGRNFGARRRCR
jgi:hypothetical protein